MKRSFLVMLVAILPALGFSQSIFDRYEDMDHVAAITINKGLINLASSLSAEGDQDAQDFMELAKGLDRIKVFVTEDKKVSTEMTATVKKYIKSSSLEELMQVKDKDVNVKFYAKEGKDEDHVNELLMFVSGFESSDLDINGRKLETVLLTLTGDIDLRKIGSLVEKMNLPDELNNAQKGK